ncbi:hypothetical protein [Legionella nagasakiensis]|uniref:hypothetical protein n=1 Tax=Legionella nagasakiensis TaxID=535290 RepID=UPI001055312B|nr:hypothetical protein [Legionella nagasakiensis]
MFKLIIERGNFMLRIGASRTSQVTQFSGSKVQNALGLAKVRRYSSMQFSGPVIVGRSHRSIVLMDIPEVSYVSHRVIIGGLASQASVLAQVQKSPELCEMTTLVSAPSWLLSIHDDWEGQPWGQPMRYLPQVSRDIAAKLFPKFDDYELLTFGMMAAIEKEQRRQIRERGIHLIEDSIARIEGTPSGVIIHCNGRTESVGDGNYEIVHTGRVPIGLEGIPVQHFGDAYSVSKKESNIPRIIVGSGLNAYWACRDFGNLGPIVHLIPPGDRLLPDLKGVLHAAVRLEDSKISDPLPDGTVLVTGKNLFSGKKIEMRVEISQIYSAMGFKLDRELVTGEPSRLRFVDTAPNPDAIKTFFSAAGASTTKAVDLRGTVVPNGNMALNYFRIQAELGHFDLREPNAVLLTTVWENEILKKAMKMGVRIEPEFFDAIESRVKHGFEKFIPSESQVWRVIRNAYEKGVPNGEHLGVTKPVATDRAGKPIAWEDFKKMILAPTERVLEEAHIKDKAEEPGVRPTM